MALLGWKTAAQESSVDRLLLHAFGIPDANNGKGEYWSTEPMLDLAKNPRPFGRGFAGRILQGISDFVGDVHQSDEIAIMIVARDRLN